MHKGDLESRERMEGIDEQKYDMGEGEKAVAAVLKLYFSTMPVKTVRAMLRQVVITQQLDAREARQDEGYMAVDVADSRGVIRQIV